MRINPNYNVKNKLDADDKYWMLLLFYHQPDFRLMFVQDGNRSGMSEKLTNDTQWFLLLHYLPAYRSSFFTAISLLSSAVLCDRSNINITITTKPEREKAFSTSDTLRSFFWMRCLILVISAVLTPATLLIDNFVV